MFNSQASAGGGFGTLGATSNPLNPFGGAQSQPSNPFSSQNPFQKAQAPAQTSQQNPFQRQASPSNPFAAAAQTTLGNQAGSKPPHNPFTANAASDAPQSSTPSNNVFGQSSGKLNSSGPTNTSEFVKPAWGGSQQNTILSTTNGGKRKVEFPGNMQNKFSRNSPDPKSASKRHSSPASRPGATNANSKTAANGARPPVPPQIQNGQPNELAAKIYAQLAKDGIKPPAWPKNPGSQAQRRAVENFRESYNTYREKARKSLIKAGLIDDPDKRRRLDEAIVFKGICEDLCPEWEKVTRIVQQDVKKEEKMEIDGETVPHPPLMVTRHARSSAGQDAPLPMDVRSPGALHRTLDYLIDELIPRDDDLLTRHGFLWDRTRAIRRDFAFQEYAMSPEEMNDQIYCLETIARFHVTALHLLSQPDFSYEDFSEQQEIEQLGKTFISLMHAYDDCAKVGVKCENEAEFRAYYVIYNAHDPALMEMIQSWDAKFWQSDNIRTALGLVTALENTWNHHGPLAPTAPTEMALGVCATVFDIVAQPGISYTMACFAEIHFNRTRKSMLQIIIRAYSRPKGTFPKDLTPAYLKQILRVDTEEDAIDFAQQHGFNFSENNAYLIVSPHQQLSDTRVPHSFSYEIVERKRGNHSLPEVIHQTVSPDPDLVNTSEEDSLFVDGSADVAQDTTEAVSNSFQGKDNASAVFSAQPSANSLNGAPTNGPSMLPPSGQPAASIFSKPNGITNSLSSFTSSSNEKTAPSIFQSGSSSPSLFSGLSGAPKASSLDQGLKQSHSAPLAGPNDDKKKVSFGETTYHEPPTQSPAPANSNASTLKPNLFSFLKNAPTDSTPAATASASSGSIFSTLQQPPQSSSQASILSGASAPTAPGFTFTSPASQPTTSPAPDSSSSSITKALPAPASTVSSSATGTETLSHATPNFPSFLNSSTQGSSTAGPPQSVMQPPPAPVVPAKDPMKEFTRWFVLADRGLMEEQLEPFLVTQLLEKTWAKFQQDEVDRKRKEEDDKSWAEARKFRTYSLGVTYFYRWLDIFRKRRVIKRIRTEKEKARQWNLAENKAKREAAAQAAKDAKVDRVTKLMRASKKSREDLSDTTSMAQTAPPQFSREDSVEAALLASGVLNGVRDPQAAARYAARGGRGETDHELLPGEKTLLRSENQRRKRRGLPPLKQFPEPKTYKEGSKSAMLRSLAKGAGRDSMSLSTGSLRNSTFSSSFRSSLGYNSSRVSKPQPKITDPYWRMKANGLVQMPSGEYLPESLALPMIREGRRFPGMGDFGLSASQSPAPSASPRNRIGALGQSPRLTPDDAPAKSILGGSSSPEPPNKRKRAQSFLGQGEEDQDLLAYRSESSSTRKRAKSGAQMGGSTSSDGDTDFLARIDSLMKEVHDLRELTSK